MQKNVTSLDTLLKESIMKEILKIKKENKKDSKIK